MMRDKYIVKEKEEGGLDFTLGIRYDPDRRSLRIGGPRRFMDNAVEILNSCFSLRGGYDEPIHSDSRFVLDVKIGPLAWRRGVESLKEWYYIEEVDRFGRLMC